MRSREPMDPHASAGDGTAAGSVEGGTERPRLRLVGGRVERAAKTEPETASPARLGVETSGSEHPLELTAASRVLHCYSTGQPGTGKTTLLLNLVLHDLATGTGCCLLDPHGGLLDRVLEACPPKPEVRDRIVVVDVADGENPVGIDLLDAESEHEQDLAVQFFLELFRGMYLLDQQGPIFFQAVRNGLLLLMEARRTLAEFPLIFTDKDYSRGLLKECGDPFVKRYFEKQWGNTTDFHKSESLGYIISKFGPFFEDRTMRRIFAQRGGLDIDAAMADRKVVIVNLARGRIGDVNARMLGQVILHLIRRSAMRRDLSENARLFNVYIDEAHEFAGQELRELLTAMRKFGVGVTFANQTIDDFYPQVRDTILGAVGTFVILRQGLAPAAVLESLVQPRFDKFDLMRLPDTTAVVCESAMGRYRAPRSVQLAPPPRGRDETQAAEIRRLSSQRYGRPRAEVEAELLHAAEGKSRPPPPQERGGSRNPSSPPPHT